MKKPFHALPTIRLAVILIAASVSCGAAAPAQPPPFSTLSAVRSLNNAQAAQALPVSFEATVTFYKNTDTDLFVQQGNDAIFVAFKSGAGLQAGDRVLVTGNTQASFRPIVNAKSVTFLRHGPAVAPIPATFGDLVSSRLDCRRVTIHALVRAADMVGASQPPGIYLHMLMDGGNIDAAINSTDNGALVRFLDAEVEIAGIATAKFDQRNQLTGARIDVQSLADVTIVKPATAVSSSLPVTPVENIFSTYRINDLSQRVRVQGTITYYQPGTTVVIQNGSESLWITTRTEEPLRVGDLADVTGFPQVRNSYLALTDAKVVDTGTQAPVQPLPVTWQQLGDGGNAFRLITSEGRVVRQIRKPAIDEYVLEAQGNVFSAVFRHPPYTDLTHSPTMRPIPVGTMVRVVGIGMFYTTDPFDGPVASDILLRSQDDIVVIAPPPLASERNLIFLVAGLLIVVFTVVARGWFIEHKVRRHTTALAQGEQQRSRILEDINGSRPLAEIIEEITKLASFRLNGAPFWCQIADGALLGAPPPNPEALRVVQSEIPSRSGPPLGTCFAAFHPTTRPRPIESVILALASELASLAINTRRLYSDLVRRSDFDQLTDVYNRFSLNQQLLKLIAKARNDASIFGLIYVDLDEFKQVNDLCGHLVGDLYLQEVAARMKRQLRSVDMLARLGGDEFAALVPQVHSRSDVEEIAQRIKHSFDEPFLIEGHLLHGSASIGISLYPEDGPTGDHLLNTADAAMYQDKHSRTPTLNKP
jgi:diguanylate cyclase (GGDEF)-like protein